MVNLTSTDDKGEYPWYFDAKNCVNLNKSNAYMVELIPTVIRISGIRNLKNQNYCFSWEIIS
jgi:hypothetical protein